MHLSLRLKWHWKPAEATKQLASSLPNTALQLSRLASGKEVY